jgi:UDP-N-acetylmuramate--alanine ligase
LATELGFDPLCIIGSSVPQFDNKNARIQDDEESDLFIAETCEYKENFLHFHPDIILLPSLDYDHTDYFKTKEDYEDAFVKFACKLPEDGILVVGGDQVPESFIEKVSYKREDINIVTYGFDPENDIIVSKPEVKDGIQSTFIENFKFKFSLSVPGSHNILNATGAFIVMMFLAEIGELDIDKDIARESLLSFSNTKRRMEKLGEFNGGLLFDDYAHHPVEIKATIDSLKSFYKDKKIRVIFQSHTFSRSMKLEHEFADSLSYADEVILTPIYPSARELETKYTSKDFANAIQKKNENLKYFDNYEDISDYLKETLSKDEIAISMGAGDTWRIIQNILS